MKNGTDPTPLLIATAIVIIILALGAITLSGPTVPAWAFQFLLLIAGMFLLITGLAFFFETLDKEDPSWWLQLFTLLVFVPAGIALVAIPLRHWIGP